MIPAAFPQVAEVLLEGAGVHDDVVQVGECVLPLGISKHPIDQPLECARASAQTERHADELIQPPVARECSFAFVALSHLDLQVSLAGVQDGEVARTPEV